MTFVVVDARVDSVKIFIHLFIESCLLESIFLRTQTFVLILWWWFRSSLDLGDEKGLIKKWEIDSRT